MHACMPLCALRMGGITRAAARAGRCCFEGSTLKLHPQLRVEVQRWLSSIATQWRCDELQRACRELPHACAHARILQNAYAHAWPHQAWGWSAPARSAPAGAPASGSGAPPERPSAWPAGCASAAQTWAHEAGTALRRLHPQVMYRRSACSKRVQEKHQHQTVMHTIEHNNAHAVQRCFSMMQLACQPVCMMQCNGAVQSTPAAVPPPPPLPMPVPLLMPDAPAHRWAVGTLCLASTCAKISCADSGILSTCGSVMVTLGGGAQGAVPGAGAGASGLNSKRIVVALAKPWQAKKKNGHHAGASISSNPCSALDCAVQCS